MITKRKKNSRQRGATTHGWGSRKKHRGAGNRGGRGMAGTGKRCDAKNQLALKTKGYFGKKGFTTKRTTFVTSTNVKFLNDNIHNFVAEGKAIQKGDVYTINLADIGVDKLIAKGATVKKMVVTCSAATQGAISAIEAAGGKVQISEGEAPAAEAAEEAPAKEE